MKHAQHHTMTHSPLHKAAAAIGAVTVATGAAQAAAPGTMLKLVGADSTATSRQLFGTVGMFMTITGGLLTQSMLRRRSTSMVLLWSAAQKACAVGAVAFGVRNGVFAPRALAVAAFDALSTAVLLAGLATQKPETNEPELRR